MQKHSYILSQADFIVDHITQLDSGCTLIESPTGTGKTTFVLDHLTGSQKVLMLVPLVVQVRQLKEQYKKRTDIVFLSGTDKSTTNTLKDHQDKHIVATYDLWPALKNSLSFSNYTLVVDEIHKMYSAGSYRADALNPILDTLASKRTFAKKLMLTATYTEPLAELANLLPDNWLTVTRATPVVKTLNINVYTESWSYHWLKAVIARLHQRTGKQIVFVRLNSNARMEKAILCLKDLGFKTLAISRKTIGQEAVKDVVNDQILPTGYDVVLTTSIFDEAINLNNAHADIDSVHIVDASAHPEEIVQFMGRLRQANPPFFLHMKEKEDFFDTTTTQEMQSCAKSLKSKYATLNNFAHAAKQLAVEFDGEIDTLEIFKGIDVVNNTLRNFLDCSVLTKTDNSVEANKAGILACCYKSDMYHTYQRYDRVEQRLQTLLPSLSVIKNVCTEKPEDSLDALVAKVEGEQILAAAKAITTVCKRIKADYQSQKTTLYAYGCAKQKAFEDGHYHENPFCPTTHKLENKYYLLAVKLCTHLTHIADIKKALIAEDHFKVIELSESYRTDMFKNELRQQLQQRIALKKPKVMPTDAIKLVGLAFRTTCNKFPLLKNDTAIKGKYGISFNQGNQQIRVEASKAMNLIVQIADVDDVNSHKPDRRYLTIKGIHWKGYRFCNATRKAAYHTKKIVTVCQKIGTLDDEFV